METKEIGWNIDNSYEKLARVFYSKVGVNIVADPKLQILNEDLAVDLGLNPEGLKEEASVEILAGNRPVEGHELLSQAYAGHQFGHFTILGDGRAALIGEQINPQGQRYDIQLKGSGRTPYSRGGDGRAGLGPMLREYIISESMYGLAIPTTRSLAVVTTGENIYREKPLAGAILTRVAKSHIRVGTFQYGASFEDENIIKSMADYTINRHFSHIKNEKNPYISLLKEVIDLQARLISKWQLVGFIHGVMNTDNMTISGETIDYGPCAFMDTYNPDTVFSSIDRKARYAYKNQPNIGGWNLARFAETLLVLIDKDEKLAIDIAEGLIKEYNQIYKKNWLRGMRLKLGLINEDDKDIALIEELLGLMKNFKADFTNTFLGLTEDTYKCLDRTDLFRSKEFDRWEKKWKLRLEGQNIAMDKVKETMKNNNPHIIPRNHLVEEALKSATTEGNYGLFNDLLGVLTKPYAYGNIKEKYMVAPEASHIAYRTYCGT